MKYRIMGKTGLHVSEIAFGCGNIGGLMVRGNPEEQLEAITHAQELGINYFDTAPAYGNGQSEKNLGNALKQIQSDVFIATKVSINRNDVKDIKGTVESSLETSLKRLGRNSVDVIQLHTPIAPESSEPDNRRGVNLKEVLGARGIADAFDYVRSQGLARFLGFTGLGNTGALKEVVNSNRFDIVQVYYNLLNPSAGQYMPPEYTGYNFDQLINTAKEHDMGVVVIRIMAGGALGGEVARTGYASPTVDGALVRGAEYQADTDRARKLGFLVSGDFSSLPQAAIKFALMHHNVSTVVVGFSDIDQIDEAAGCSDKEPIPEIAMHRLADLWASDFGIH